MTSASRLTEATRRGVAHLHEAQLGDGSFLTYTSSDPVHFKETQGQVTTFMTALILSATGDLEPGSPLREVRERAAHFLLEQRSPTWTFNYWPRGSKQAHPYPDDLDDTFCALAALQQYQPELVTPEALAAAVRQLTLCESQVGGPYRTWIVPPTSDPAWRDVDLGVNSNVAAFLASQGVQMPHLVELVEEAIRTSSFTTPYYAASPYPVMYFISRFYRGPMVGELQRYLLEQRDAEGWWNNPLDSALAISALLNTGAAAADVAQAVSRLLEAEVEGTWPARALYLELSQGKRTVYAGGSAVTTAFVLEALNKYGRAQVEPAAAGHAPEAENLYQEIVGRVHGRFDQLPADLKHQATLALNRQLERDKDKQIVLLPYFWEQSLQPSQTSATHEELITLGMASLYGWISYTIYDDFLDDEGSPPLLSVAHVAMRELVHLFASIRPDKPAVAALVEGVMDRIDAANTWEVVHARAKIERGTFTLNAIPNYGDFGQLAGRSLGHALGPLCLLLIRGHQLDEPVIEQTLKFFTHYLIARQLNDDVHDWEEDLGRGQVNAVGALLLSADGAGLKRQPLRPLLAGLKKQLWSRDIAAVCDHILRHAEQARQALKDNPELSDKLQLARLLDPLERSAREAIQKRDEANAFIAAYQSAPKPK